MSLPPDHVFPAPKYRGARAFKMHTGIARQPAVERCMAPHTANVRRCREISSVHRFDLSLGAPPFGCRFSGNVRQDAGLYTGNAVRSRLCFSSRHTLEVASPDAEGSLPAPRAFGVLGSLPHPDIIMASASSRISFIARFPRCHVHGHEPTGCLTNTVGSAATRTGKPHRMGLAFQDANPTSKQSLAIHGDWRTAIDHKTRTFE